MFYKEHRTPTESDGYFRFKPPYLGDVGLDESKKKDIIADRTAALEEDPVVKSLVDKFWARNEPENDQGVLNIPHHE